MLESPCLQLWIWSWRSLMRSLSESEKQSLRSFQISNVKSIHIIDCLIEGLMERVSHDITMRLQRLQASCIGSVGRGQGSVPKRKCSLFLDLSARIISRSHWWKLLSVNDGETRTTVGFSPGWRKYGLTGLTRWSEVECWLLTAMVNKKEEDKKDQKRKLNLR